MTLPIYTASYPSFSRADRLALAALIRQVARPQCKMAEIGSWLGTGSTQVFLAELATIEKAELVCIDTWKGSENVQAHQEIAKSHDVLNTFRANISGKCEKTNVTTVISNSITAAGIICDNVFDLVFIDADHSYQSVRDDIAAWRRTVKKGGILCGHDCEMRASAEFKEMLTANMHKDALPMNGIAFAAIHPGSVLAVDEAFGLKARLWAEEQPFPEDQEGPVGRSTIWYVVMDD
jgi:predicted O-methyltransferase YrrM